MALGTAQQYVNGHYVNANTWDDWRDIAGKTITFTKYSTLIDGYQEEKREMSLADKYVNRNRTADDELLIKHKVVSQSGKLTEAGQELVAQIWFEQNREAVMEFVKQIEAKKKAAASTEALPAPTEG